MPDYVKTALRLARGLGKLHPEGAAGFTPAKGAPEVIKLPGIGRVQARPIEPIQETARSYMTQRGMTPKSPEFVPINPDYSKRVAGAYEAMQHDPRDPAVRRAYEALADETMDQFKAAQPLGIKYEFVKPGQKDQLPALGYSDLLNKGKLSVYPTSEGFGANAGFEDSPLLKPVGRIGDNPNAVVNDAFRIVHDLYGHYGPGNAHFRAPGEERAFQLHSQMYSPEALPAAASETRGQNSWVNYGPHGEFNRTAPADQTIFADQKTGIMPAWAYELPPAEGEDVDAYIKSLGGKAKGGQVLSEEHTVPSKTNFIDPETGAIGQTTTEQTSKVSIGRGKFKSGGGAWTRAEGKNPNGGLNEKGRASLRAQGHDIKRPQPEGGSRRDSFCARMKGMKAKLTSKETANDPDSRINKSLRAWKCADGGAVWDKPRPEHLGKPHHLSSEQKSKAKAAAKAAGRPYPNLVDNMRAAKADGGSAIIGGEVYGGRTERGTGGKLISAAVKKALNTAATALNAGHITPSEYRDLADTMHPVMPYKAVPRPATTEAMVSALKEGQRQKVGLGSQIEHGTPVGLRLDIPAYSNHDTWVPTIHPQGQNTVLAHESAASVDNPVFNPSPNKAYKVAQGAHKAPFATINGAWRPTTPEEAHAAATEALGHPDWRQVGYDPNRRSFFYDRETMQPIESAEQAIQVGPLVMAKKPVYGDVENYPYRNGGHVEKAMRLIDRMHKDQGGGTDPSQFIHEQLFSGEPQLPQVNRDVEGLTEGIGNAAMQLGKTAAYLHPVTRGAMGVYDLAHGAMTGNPAEMATAVAGAPSKMARAIGAGAFAEDARGGKYARGGYATDGSVDGDVSYAPDDSQSFENSGSMMVQGYGEDQPQKTAHDFVQQQLNTGEPQLPQMDREAYDAWKYGVPMAAAHMAAYEIPYVGQTLAGYDAANAMKELASPEVREQLANKNYIAALPALADAGLSAMGLKGSKALVGAGALGTGLLASNEAQARSPQSEFLTRLAHAYRSHYDPAARIAGMPTTFKQGKEVAKNWLSGNKLSRPIEEMELQSQGHRPMVAESFSRPEDYAGKALITGLGDRTPAGYELTHINDRQLFRPVNFMGGYGFGRDIASQGRDRAIWGSGLSRARAIANRGKAAADAGYEPIFTYVAQAPESADYSHHMQDILLGQLDPARMDPKKAEFVDKRMREATTGSGSVFEPKPNWVGIQSPYMAQRLAERGDERVKLTKLLDAAQFRDDPAFADIGAARFASTDPNLMYDPSFSAGKAFFTMNPKGEVVKDPLHPHPSYNTQISAAPGRHGYLGRLEYELPPEIHYQNYLENEIKPELRGKPFARQTMSLLKQTPTVIATPEWVDKASQWQDIMRGLYGSRRKHGGKVKGALRLAQKLASKG